MSEIYANLLSKVAVVCITIKYLTIKRNKEKMIEKGNGMSDIDCLSVRGIIIIGALLFHSKWFVRSYLVVVRCKSPFFQVLFTYNCSVFVNK